MYASCLVFRGSIFSIGAILSQSFLCCQCGGFNNFEILKRVFFCLTKPAQMSIMNPGDFPIMTEKGGNVMDAGSSTGSAGRSPFGKPRFVRFPICI